jgi:hypothetical protein
VTNSPSYTCYTLFDIPDRGNRSQVRNWNTLIQILSLRTQPFITKFPECIEDDLATYSFGKHYTGEAKIWSFEFEIEHPDLFADKDDPIAHLVSDTQLVPLVDHNNFIIPPKCLITNGDYCNIYYAFNK